MDILGFKKEQLAKTLEQQGMKLAVLFGSQVTGHRHPGSDIDVGVVFGEPTKDFLQSYVDAEDAFKAYFGRKTKKARLQIVDLDSAPLSLRFKAIEDGQLLYVASARFFTDYREQLALEYFDFQPVEDYCKKVFLGQTL